MGIPWLKSVKCVKVFGVFICDSYAELLGTNWDFRFNKFRNAVLSWSSRLLSTLQQRIEVIRVFALSRVFYIASILPIKSGMVNKFESLIGKFIWQGSGKILRVAIGELKNDHLSGGLNLPCLSTMNDSLLASQCARLLRSGDAKSVAHMDYWIGSLVAELVPGLGLGIEATKTHEYFAKLADTMALVMMSETLNASTINNITNKVIYKDLASFPTPKVELEANCDYKVIWKRLRCLVIDSEARDILFLLIHNKLPVPERLFRVGVRSDPYCPYCPNAVIADIEHFYCNCERSKLGWAWIRLKIGKLCQQGSNPLNWELLNLFLPNTQFEREILWLISSYIGYVWKQCYMKNRHVEVEKLFGFLTFKYRASGLMFGKNLGLE